MTFLKLLTVAFIISMVSPAIAADQQVLQPQTQAPLQQEFIKIKIPSGISNIDLRGTGKDDDRVINSETFEGGRIETNTTVFLTSTGNAALPYYFVGMPERVGGGISSFSAKSVSCAIWNTSFLRDARNPKNVYMLTTYRSSINADLDAGNVVAPYKISLYTLTSDERHYYTFHQIKTVSVPHYKACTFTELDKLAQIALEIKVREDQ